MSETAKTHDERLVDKSVAAEAHDERMAATPNTLVGASWPLTMPPDATPPATATGFRHPEPINPREFGEAMARTRKQKGRNG